MKTDRQICCYKCGGIVQEYYPNRTGGELVSHIVCPPKENLQPFQSLDARLDARLAVLKKVEGMLGVVS